MKVELRNISKSFGPVQANDDINLIVPSGTIQGLLGENGAGKSTLMKILSGFIQADKGEILLNDKPVVIQSPADAIRHGIGMLHQDPLDFPPMQVVENFLIGSPTSRLFPNRKAAAKDFLKLEKTFGFDLDPDAYVDSLTVGERQQVEILRLLWLGAQVLILDEPTTGISALQKEKLFETLRLLVGEGKTIIFVSHKLDEVEQLCDRVAVLRQGQLVGEAFPPYDPDHLVEMMFSKVVSPARKRNYTRAESSLQLKNLSVEDYRLHLEDVSFTLHKGEVIGLAGMEGSGQELLLKGCAGLVRPTGGEIIVEGEDLTGKSYRDFLDHGVRYLPAARLEEGLIPGLTLTEHFILSENDGRTFINWDSARKLARSRIAEYNIHGRPDSTVEALSGGNQQRALLALLQTPLRVVLLEHPTRGLDIESTIYIWSKLKERCAQGTSVIFISSDLDEVLRYSDRVLVFFSGKVSSPIEAATTNVEQLGHLIGGLGWEQAFGEKEPANA